MPIQDIDPPVDFVRDNKTYLDARDSARSIDVKTWANDNRNYSPEDVIMGKISNIGPPPP